MYTCFIYINTHININTYIYHIDNMHYILIIYIILYKDIYNTYYVELCM